MADYTSDYTGTEIDAGIAKTADGTFAPALGADDNYVTDAEKVVIGNTSGTNTGNQDLSGHIESDPTPFPGASQITNEVAISLINYNLLTGAETGYDTTEFNII